MTPDTVPALLDLWLHESPLTGPVAITERAWIHDELQMERYVNAIDWEGVL